MKAGSSFVRFRHDRVVNNLDEMIAAAAKLVRKAGPADNGATAGQLEGLTATGRARLRPLDDENVYHHGGYLGGHLLRWMSEHGRNLDESFMLTLGFYSACLADPYGQRCLCDLSRLFDAHLYAAISVEGKFESPMDEPVERMLLGWLLEQANARPTEALVPKLERMRERRHQRLGL